MTYDDWTVVAGLKKAMLRMGPRVGICFVVSLGILMLIARYVLGAERPMVVLGVVLYTLGGISGWVSGALATHKLVEESGLTAKVLLPAAAVVLILTQLLAYRIVATFCPEGQLVLFFLAFAMAALGMVAAGRTLLIDS